MTIAHRMAIIVVSVGLCGGPPAIAETPQEPSARPALTGRFAALDVDGDGALGREEVGPVARRQFADLDRNGDGVLDADELAAYVARTMREGRAQPVPAPTPPLAGQRPTFADVTAYLDDALPAGKLTGIALRVERSGTPLYEHTAGDIAPETVVPVASGSKWMTAALLMTLVDDGTLELDAPLAVHLPYLKGTPAEGVTLRQALSHTAGFASEHLLTQPFDMDLAASARAVAGTRMESAPGTAFRYTGAAMQLAAAAAEAAAGRPWNTLFRERITEPLGMEHTTYGHPMREIGFAGNHNLIAESGVHTTLRDYSRFLEMIAAKGVFRGTRILGEGSIATMETDQTRGLEMAVVPPGARAGWGYGLGEWCETSDEQGRCARVNSGGAFGAFPWLDRQRDLYGVLLVVDTLPRVVDRILATRALVDAVVDQPAH